MNILYLSPNFPPNYTAFPLRLRDEGAVVAGIGWEAPERLPPELRGALAEYCRVENMGDYDHVLRAAAWLLSRIGRFDRVVAQEEHFVDLEAALRLDFNVPGLKPADIVGLRHKSRMKEGFARAQVPTAAWELATDAAAGQRFARRVGYPIIAKPDKGVGAHATYKLSDDAELTDFFAVKDPRIPFLLEEFLAGVIQSFDGLTDRDGGIVFCTGHQFSIDIMTAVNQDQNLHYWSFRDLPADLEAQGRRSIAAFGLKERFFHLEFIRGPRGKLTAMEINARPPGGLTTDMFNYANDIDVYRGYAELVVHGDFRAEWKRPYHVSYVGRKNGKPYRHSHEDILRAHGDLIVSHTPIDSVFRKAIGDYAYLARARSLAELQPVADFIHQLEA